MSNEERENEKQVQEMLLHDISRLSRAATLVDRVLKNLEDVNSDDITLPMKLYCSRYEIKSVKNILEHIRNDYKKQIAKG